MTDDRNLLDRKMPRLMAALKSAVYRTPIARNALRPRYPYWVTPGTLSQMVQLINQLSTRSGAVVEVGVARGITSVFLLEHLRTTEDPRPLIMIDTFSGFTKEDVYHEVRHRRRRKQDLSDFSYGSAKAVAADLDRLGYRNYQIIVEDCTVTDWSDIGPIAALLLDVDLYRPTKTVLERAWPHLLPGGGIVVDDCVTPHWADGSMEAYVEFINACGLPFTRVGGKAAMVQKSENEA